MTAELTQRRNDSGETNEQTTARMRVWLGDYGRDYPDEPDETVEIPIGENELWEDDPHYYSGSIAFDIHPEDRPATLYVYTNDSVREPPKSDTSEWGRPVESGLPYEDTDDYPPFGCRLWGRVLVRAENGLTR